MSSPDVYQLEITTRSDEQNMLDVHVIDHVTAAEVEQHTRMWQRPGLLRRGYMKFSCDVTCCPGVVIRWCDVQSFRVQPQREAIV